MKIKMNMLTLQGLVPSSNRFIQTIHFFQTDARKLLGFLRGDLCFIVGSYL